jgi:hypothetical protein
MAPMRSTRTTSANELRKALLDRAVREILAVAAQPGFYGTVSVELSVQDGVIQHVRQKVDRIER